MNELLVTVDRQRYRLELWYRNEAGTRYVRHGKYTVGLGQVGHATPRGVYLIDGKSRRPDWRAPDAEWVPIEDRGTIFTYDNPRNPFEGGFISLSGGNGVGIHGTKFDPMVGTRGSHGCIRMRTQDLLKIYERLPLQTPVVIL